MTAITGAVGIFFWRVASSEDYAVLFALPIVFLAFAALSAWGTIRNLALPSKVVVTPESLAFSRYEPWRRRIQRVAWQEIRAVQLEQRLLRSGYGEARMVYEVVLLTDDGRVTPPMVKGLSHVDWEKTLEAYRIAFTSALPEERPRGKVYEPGAEERRP